MTAQDAAVNYPSSCFNINLVSNASMATFPQNTLASFTTLLPQPLQLDQIADHRRIQYWTVALVEISWPSRFKNITQGRFNLLVEEEEKVSSSSSSRVDAYLAGLANLNKTMGRDSSDDDDAPSNKYSRSAADEFVVSREDPTKRLRTTKTKQQRQIPCQIETGNYDTLELLMDSIAKQAIKKMGAVNNDEGSQKQQQRRLDWNLKAPTQQLKCRWLSNSSGGSGPAAAVVPRSLKLLSSDMIGIFGTDTVPISNNNKQDDDDDTGDTAAAAQSMPIDLYGGTHTLFVYCDLIQNEILGDNHTALLRAMPLCSSNNERSKTSHPSPPPATQYQTFAKLQWKRVVKSSFQQISISLRDETGQLMPFLALGRTSLTLQFRKVIVPV